MEIREANGEGSKDERLSRVERLVFDVLQRRNKGDDVRDSAIIAEHPELMPELGWELRLAAEIEEGAVEASVEASVAATMAMPPKSLAGQSIEVRCPDCRSSIDLRHDTSLANIQCPVCGIRFNLIGDDDASQRPQIPKRLAHFELLECLGQGSFGSVWKAYDRELDRTVAVKIPREGQLLAVDVDLFFREARASAQLNHPNIVRVYEVGREQETVFIVSEFIDGVTLAESLIERRPSFRQAAQWCETTAEALQHAHARGIVHRDLKPQNVMIAQGKTPVVMDFGLAKRATGEVTMTQDGHELGTPAYMSPEQARGEGHRADARSDVYSLGAILFEMLTGELPFRGNTPMMIQQVVNEEPPRLRKLNANIPRDLETICLKCLEKEASRRYSSAGEVAEELRRFLEGEPIVARPISALGRGYRWCRRNLALSLMSAAAGLLLLALAIGGPLAAWQQNRLSEANRSQLYTSDMSLAMDACNRRDWKTVRDLLGRHVPSGGQRDLRGFEWYVLFDFWRTAKGARRIDVGASVHTVSTIDDEHLLVGHDKGLSVVDLETWQMRDLLKRRQDTALSLQAEVSPSDPSFAVSGSKDGVLRFHDLRHGSARTVWTGEKSDEFWRFAFSKDGRKLATTVWENGVGNNRVCIFDTKVGIKAPRDLLAPGHGFWDVCFSPDGNVIATAGWDDGTIRLWNANDLTQLGEAIEAFGPVSSLRFSHDGRLLIAGCGDRFLRVWSNKSAEAEYRLVHEQEAHDSRINAIVLSKNNRMLASASHDASVKLWRLLPSGRIRLMDEFMGYVGYVSSVCFLGDSKLASAATDGRVIIWNSQNNKQRHVLRGHSNVVRAVDITSDGRYVASGGHDYLLRIWDLKRDASYALEGHTGAIRDLAYSPDETLIATGGWDGYVIVWDARKRILLKKITPGAPVWSVWFSSDGQFL